MASIPSAIVNHLRADSTLTTAMGLDTAQKRTDRIGFERMPDKSLPCLAVVLRSETRTASCIRDQRVEIWVWVDTDNRSMIETVKDRLAALFHDKTYYFLDSGSLNQLCTQSEAIAGDDDGIFKIEDDKAWQSVTAYRFVCPT